MAFQPFEHWVNADLKAEVPVVQLRNGFFTQDNLGALLGVKVFDNGQEHALTGSVLFYAKLADGTTLEGDSVQPDGNTASVILPSEAYAAVGPISVAIANRDGAKQKVLAIFTGYVYETKTDAEVAPGQTVADLAQLQAQYQAMLTATANAVTATTNAEKVNIAQTKTDHTITVTTTDRNGTDTAKTITEPTVALRSENGEISLEVTDSNGTSSTSFSDPSEEVKQKVNRSSVTATRTISGTGSVTVDDALDEPAKIELKLNPKQDLHGYDKPWVGGAGKNRLGIRGIWTLSGKISAATNGYCTDLIVVTPGQKCTAYRNTELPDSCNMMVRLFDSSGAFLRSSQCLANNETGFKTWTVPSDTYKIGVVQFIDESQDLSQLRMMFATEEVSTYEPYSNICPIEGYDSVELQASGKNLWDGIWENGGIGLTNGVNQTGSGCRGKNYIPVMPETEYFMVSSIHDIRLRCYDKTKQYIGPYDYDGNSPILSNTVFKTPANCYYIRIASQDGETTMDGVGVNYPATETGYVSYVGNNTVSLNLVSTTGSTVYGGTVTVNEDGSGTVVVDRVKALFSDVTWIANTVYSNTYNAELQPTAYPGHALTNVKLNQSVSNKYKWYMSETVGDQDYGFGMSVVNGNIYYVKDKDIASVEEANTKLADLEICYPLATPQTYTLTASQLSTLLGTTHVITDTDEPLTVTYRTDKYLTVQSIDDIVALLIDGTNTTEMFYKWWSMTENENFTRYEKLSRWFALLAKAWKDKLYILECPSAENQSTSAITYKGDLKGKTPAEEWLDEDPMTWYIRVNGLNQADGTLDVLAIEGLDDDFDITGELAPVQTVSMALWVNIRQDTDQWIYNGQYTVNGTGSDNGVRTYVYFSTSPTKENSNFPDHVSSTFLKPLPGDVMPNGKHRSLTWHSTFPGGLTSDGKLTSGRGLQPYIYQSASSGLTAARKWSNDEALWNDCDSLWLLLQWQLRHGDLENSGIMEGCQAFNFQWMCAEATTDQNYVLLPASAYTVFQNIDRNAVKYVCLSVGEMGTNTNKDRGQSYMYNILDRGQVKSVAMSGGYCKVTFFTTTTFSTTTTTCVSTMPWYSGATEAIAGKGDCAPTTSPLLGYTPIRVAGVEIMSGAYDVSIEPLYYATYDSSTATTTYTVNECRTASKLATSVTSDYINTGLGNTTPWATGWQYVKSFNFDLTKGALFPKTVGGSDTTYYKSAFYVTPSSGARVPYRSGYLNLGALAGLACCSGSAASGNVSWALRPRLSGSGANRGEYTE